MNLRDRIIKFEKLKASELIDNTGNWRTHPEAQRDSMDGVLREIGIADSLIAYYSERNGGKLTLIDGHLRKSIDPEQEWHVQITDLNDQEADMLMMVLDPLAGMAGMDKSKAIDLMENINTGEWAVRELLRNLEMQAKNLADEALKDDAKSQAGSGLPEMELLPFEHYDYMLVMFRNELDWLGAVEFFGLERQLDPRKTNRVGLSRVIDGAKLMTLVRDKVSKVETQ